MEGAGVMFTQANKMKLQRLMQGMSQAQEWLDNGEIDDNEFADLSQQLQQRIAPLAQQQQQEEQQAKQKAYQEAMEQHSQMEAMEMQAAKMRADAFHDRLVPVVDPTDPNKWAVMYEKSRGVWEAIPFQKGGGEATEGPSDG